MVCFSIHSYGKPNHKFPMNGISKDSSLRSYRPVVAKNFFLSMHTQFIYAHIVYDTVILKRQNIQATSPYTATPNIPVEPNQCCHHNSDSDQLYTTVRKT